MNVLFTYFLNLRHRHLAKFLAQHGRRITIAIRESQTLDDASQQAVPEQRYLHIITATWTDPKSGKAYAFARQFRTARKDTLKVGDLTTVLIDPQDYRRYLVQV